MAPDPPVFLLGSGLNGLWVVRSLGRRRIPVCVFDDKPDDIAYHSRYVRSVHRLDDQEPDSIAAALVEAAGAFDRRPVLFATNDYYTQYASEHRAELSEFLVVQLPPADSIATVVDKERFRRFSEEHGLPVPRTWTPASRSELQESIPDMEFPVVLKPARSFTWAEEGFVRKHGRMKMVLAGSPGDLDRLWRELADDGHGLIVQEYIRGGDEQHYSYFSYRNRNGRELCGLCVRKYRVYPVHAGAIAFGEAVVDEELRSLGREVLGALNYNGMGSVCFKRDSRTMAPKVFEVNGRLPLGHSAFQMCGVDLPYLMYRDFLGLPVPPTRVRNIGARWVALKSDMWAFVDYHREGEIGFLAWLRSFAGLGMCAEYAPDDPAPFRDFLRSSFPRAAIGVGRAVLGGLRRRLRRKEADS